MSDMEQYLGLQAVEAYVPGISATLSLAITKNAELKAENERLRSQIAELQNKAGKLQAENLDLWKTNNELQAWIAAVPVQAIRDVNGSHVPVDDVIAGVDTVDAWLASLTQPEVQP